MHVDSDFFAYMVILLDRVETITPLEKARMKEVLNMYNSLWDQSPIIQKMKAASEVEGEIKAFQKGVRIRKGPPKRLTSLQIKE